jgi:hypothetical protein
VRDEVAQAGKAVEAADAGDALDLVVSNRAGNASFSLRTPHGCTPAGALPFGGFPAPGDDRAWSENLQADERFRGRNVFLVRTRTGAIASVRIRTWSHEPEFDYVLRLR